MSTRYLTDTLTALGLVGTEVGVAEIHAELDTDLAQSGDPDLRTASRVASAERARCFDLATGVRRDPAREEDLSRAEEALRLAEAAYRAVRDWRRSEAHLTAARALIALARLDSTTTAWAATLLDLAARRRRSAVLLRSQAAAHHRQVDALVGGLAPNVPVGLAALVRASA